MQSSRTSLFFAPLLILGLFGPTLIGTERLAFRDVSHFYTPLYDYVALRTSEQWLPLWNPLDQTGIPLMGETSTAVIYPVRYLLFSLPIATETALAWYVVLHLILASVTARFAAIWSGLSTWSANLVGIVYPLSGSLIFLYTNPPFLVGAAWMPLVLGIMLSKRLTDTRTRIAIAAPAMSMMILGGDPQTALHTMIVIGGFHMVQCCRHLETTLTTSSVIAVPVLAAMLSAPQLAASISWSRQSDRIAKQETGTWYAPPSPNSGRAESFQYSLAPWHVIELATPNAFGSLFPIYRRISHLIVGDGRMWTPTIYMGMITIVGLMIGVADRRFCALDRWSVIALIALWLSMGHFGFMMAIQSVTNSWPNVDRAVGSPYWVLYQLIPGYDAFRYPAKWLPVFTLGAAITAARVVGLYQWRRPDWRWFALAGLILVGVLATVTAIRSNPNWITHQVDPIRPDEFWGPIDIGGGLAQIQGSVVHSLAVTLGLLSLTLLRTSAPTRMFVLLIIVGVDLGIAGRGLIATVPIAREQTLIDQRSSETFVTGSRWMRTVSDDGWPDAWKQLASDQRMLDVETSLRVSRFGRWHLADRIGMFNNMVSIQSQNMDEFWKAANELTATMSATQRSEFFEKIRDWLAIDGVIHVPTTTVEPADRERTAILSDQRLSWSPQPTRLRFFSANTRSSVTARNRQPFINRLSELVSKSEAESLASINQIDSESAIYSGVKTEDAGVLTRPIFQDGHWVAAFAPAGTEEWQPVKVFQVDRLTQGIELPAGSWDVRFVYKPSWLFASLGIAGMTWVSLLVWCRQ